MVVQDIDLNSTYIKPMILTVESDKSWWALGTFYDCEVFYLFPCVIR